MSIRKYLHPSTDHDRPRFNQPGALLSCDWSSPIWRMVKNHRVISSTVTKNAYKVSFTCHSPPCRWCSTILLSLLSRLLRLQQNSLCVKALGHDISSNCCTLANIAATRETKSRPLELVLEYSYSPAPWLARPREEAEAGHGRPCDTLVN